MLFHGAVGAFGLVLLIDGLLRGEVRHQAVAVALGAVLMLPLAMISVGGERALKLCNRLAFSFATVALLGIGLEVAARALDLRVFNYPEVVTDPILGHAYVPNRGGHDAWGHRNPRVPESADVVCIGDSQTFGTNVRRDENYSSVLARTSGREVYNMSVGGYGPLQYVELAKRSLQLEPELVTIGYYLGNDIPDGHRFLGLDTWADLRDPNLAYTHQDDANYGDKSSPNIAMWLADSLMLRSLVLRRIGSDLKLAAKLNPTLHGAVGSTKTGMPFEAGAISTRLKPRLRIGCVDLSLPHVQDGFRITQHCFEELRAMFAEADVKAAVLLIHNKSYYYHKVMTLRGETIPPLVIQLAELEEILTARIAEVAAAAGMIVVDPTDRLVETLVGGVPIFPPDGDVHLNRRGNEIAGRALAQALATL
jgi:lysophospholipase L1-like esterase